MDAPVHTYQAIGLLADVTDDAYIHEKHTPSLGESIGRPLLRAVNILESVESIYDIFSLHELLALATDYHLFEMNGLPLRKILVTLELSATLVFSENQNSIDLSQEKFEFIKFTINSDTFDYLDARLEIEESMRIVET